MQRRLLGGNPLGQFEDLAGGNLGPGWADDWAESAQCRRDP